MHRVVVEWTGGAVVGRSVTVLHFDGTEQAAPPVAAIRSAFQIIQPNLPTGTTITVPGQGDSIETTTGALNGVWSALQPAAVVGPAGQTSAAGVGACVTWNTGGIVPGKKGPRKLRGRTFLVPLSTGVYDSDGTLLSSALTTINAYATAMLGTGGFGIWHRPTTPGGTNGNSYGVISYKVRDKVAFLSSRRD